jgi:hypothetical protein
MFKRVRWLGMGAVAGVGASAWAQRRLRRTLDQHPSIRTGAGLLAGARRVGRDVGAAVADGRQAMNQREAVLRADLDRRRGQPDGASPSSPGDVRFTPGRRPDLHGVHAGSSPLRPAGPRDAPKRNDAPTHRDGPGHPSVPTKPAGPDDHVPARARRRQWR